MNYYVRRAQGSFRGVCESSEVGWGRWAPALRARGRCSSHIQPWRTEPRANSGHHPVPVGHSHHTLAHSSPGLPLGSGPGWLQSRCWVEHSRCFPLPGEQGCASLFPIGSQCKYLLNSMPILFSPCKSNAKPIAFGGNILLEHGVFSNQFLPQGPDGEPD